MNSFFAFAKSVSAEHMQTLWGRVLAKEVGQPGSFSIRSLETLKRMTYSEAVSFATACKLTASFSPKMPRKMIIISYHNSSSSLFSPLKALPEIDLYDFALGLLEQKHLASIGLLYDDKLISGVFERGEEIKLYFAKSVIVLTPRKRKLCLTHFQLTQVGLELSSLVGEGENSTYLAKLKENLASGFVMNEIPGTS
jgi:uncharacterized repeat protein (TIGR03899 family)